MDKSEKTIEFRQDLTRAALVLIQNRRKKLDELEGIIARARKEQLKKNAKQTEEWIICSWELESNILKRDIEQLEKDIITQKFDW